MNIVVQNNDLLYNLIDFYSFQILLGFARMRRRWKIGRGVYPWHAGWAWPAKLLFLSTLCSQFSLAPSLEPPGHVIRYDGDVNIGKDTNYSFKT